YCESDYANDYYCTAYRITMVLATLVETHNGALTAIATVFVGAFTYTLYKATKGLVDAAETQSGDMRRSIEAAEQSAAAAQASAETAKAQVEATQAQIEIDKIGIFDLER